MTMMASFNDLALSNENNRDFCRPRTKGRREASCFEVYDCMNSHFVRLPKKLATDLINTMVSFKLLYQSHCCSGVGSLSSSWPIQ